jgi:hypothetical protein
LPKHTIKKWAEERPLGRWLVIDSNMIQEQGLTVFLAADARNVAVVAFEIWFELYKQRSVDGMRRGLEIIGRYPDQLVVLRGSGQIMRLDPWAPDLPGRMMLPNAGESVREMAAILSPESGADPKVQSQLAEKWDWAAEVNMGMIEGAREILASLPEMQEQLFTKAEIDRIRKRGDLPHELLEVIFGAADRLWQEFSRMLDILWEPWVDRRGGTLHYRIALGVLVYLLWWISNGSQSRRKLEATRNDVIDLFLAVQATYFDGLLSRDRKAHAIHDRLKDMLIRFYRWPD